jgi:hypothetical protein
VASTALVRDLLWRVSVLLGDTAPQFQRFPERELVHWLNDGQLTIVKIRPEAGARVDSLKLVPGSKQSIDTIPATSCIPGDGSTPTLPVLGMQMLDVVRYMGTDGRTPGSSIQQTERKILDSFNNGWHLLTAANPDEWVYDARLPRVFYVIPGVAVGGNVWIEISYTAQPLKIPNGPVAIGSEIYLNTGSNAQTITISDDYLDDLYAYMMIRASFKDSKYADKALAAAFGTMFQGSIAQKGKTIRDYDPNLQDLAATPGVA